MGQCYNEGILYESGVQSSIWADGQVVYTVHLHNSLLHRHVVQPYRKPIGVSTPVLSIVSTDDSDHHHRRNIPSGVPNGHEKTQEKLLVSKKCTFLIT